MIARLRGLVLRQGSPQRALAAWTCRIYAMRNGANWVRRGLFKHQRNSKQGANDIGGQPGGNGRTDLAVACPLARDPLAFAMGYARIPADNSKGLAGGTFVKHPEAKSKHNSRL